MHNWEIIIVSTTTKIDMIVFYKSNTYNIFHPILFNTGCSHVVVHNIKLLCTFLRTATRAAPCTRQNLAKIISSVGRKQYEYVVHPPSNVQATGWITDNCRVRLGRVRGRPPNKNITATSRRIHKIIPVASGRPQGPRPAVVWYQKDIIGLTLMKEWTIWHRWIILQPRITPLWRKMDYYLDYSNKLLTFASTFCPMV